MAGGRPSTGKITISRRITPSLVPILDSFIKMLEENNGMVTFQRGTIDSVPQEVKYEKPIERFGISPNEFLKSIGKETLVVSSVSPVSKTQEEKNYTAWQSEPLMQDIYNSCLWDAGGDNQCYPDGVEKYQVKYRALWTHLIEAKRNNKNQLCNEIMTELYERIKEDE